MKKLKSYITIGILFVSILGTIQHFVYEISGHNFVVGLFAPVNESTWEHMKLLFFPMLLFSFYGRIYLTEKYPYINSSMAFGILLGTLLIPVLFYTYSGILGFNIAVIDISIFYISVIAAFYVAYLGTISGRMEKYKSLLNTFLLLFTAAFILFTVFPPSIGLFASP